MSGGSYNYIYSILSEECEGAMYDEEMDALISDLCKVLHDLEWWQSNDKIEKDYRETVAKFKIKWFHLGKLKEEYSRGFEEGYKRGKSEKSEKVAVWREVPYSEESPFFSKLSCSNCKTETFGGGYKYCPVVVVKCVIIFLLRYKKMGCKDCIYSPKTYEEYCVSKSNPARYCPDAYTEKAQYCGNYEKDKEDE